jgi:hypothetical protein
MSEVDRIVVRFDQVMHGSAWHGDAGWEILKDISPEAAAKRAIPDAHSIWEIVMHMIFWEEVATERLAGKRAGLIEERNFPAMPKATQEHWDKTVNQFRDSNHKFRAALSKLEVSRLDELSAAGKRTFYDEAHGLIEHHIYHLGQIALLKKAM